VSYESLFFAYKGYGEYMTTSENSKPKRKPLKKWQIVAIAILVLFVIGSLSGGGQQTTTSSSSSGVSEPDVPQVDLFTKRACRKWYEAINEGGKGIQTTAEIREGIKVVYEAAQFSEIPAIVDAATRQLAAITSGDVEAFGIAGNDFGNACKAAGQ
jgi:hypothetical protein